VRETLLRSLLLAGAVLLALPSFAAQGAAPASAAQSGINGWGATLTDVPPDPSIRFGTLPNGMKYAVMRNATPKGAASLRLHFAFGSLAESERERGLAHFVEHMVFNGSKRVAEGEFVKSLERLGMKFGPDTNALTSFDSTVYVLDLPQTDAGRVDQALFLLRESVSEVTFDPAAVERERGVILGERRARESYQLHQQVDRLRFNLPLAPYADRLPIGSSEVTRTASAEDLRSLYHRYYRPELATLVFVGDADPAEMAAKISAAFADWQGVGPAGAPMPRGRVDLGRRTAIDTFYNIHVPTNVSMVIMRPWSDPADTRTERRRQLIQSLGTSILSKRLTKLASLPGSVLLGGSASTGAWKDAALTSAITVTASDGAWREALAAAEQELRRALTHGFTDAELKRELANVAGIRRQAASQADTRRSEGLASIIVSTIDDQEFITTPAWRLADFNAIAPGIALDDLNAEFRRNWSGSAPLIHVSDKKRLSSQAIASAFDASRRVAVAQASNGAATSFAYDEFGPAGKVVEDRLIEDLGIRTIRFANNVRLNIKRTDFEKGRVRYGVRLAGGQLVMPRDKPGLSMMLNMISAVSGTRRHSLEDIKDLLAGRIVQAGFAVDSDAFIAVGATNPEDLALQMKLSAAYLVDPGFRPEAESRWANAIPVVDKQINSQPTSVLEAKLPLALFDDGRFGIPDASVLGRRHIAEARALLAEASAKAPIEIGIVGDIDEQAAIDAVANSFATLPARSEPVEAAEAREISIRAKNLPVILFHEGPSDQAMVASLWPTDDDRDYRKVVGLGLLASLLELKLSETVRERLGATYGVNVDSAMSDTFTGLGTIMVNAIVSPKQADQVEAAIIAAARELRDIPISEDLLIRARNPRLESVSRDLRENGYWLGYVSRAQGQAERLDRIRQRRKIYEDYTAGELQRLARTYLTDDKLRRIRVLSSKLAGKSKTPAPPRFLGFDHGPSVAFPPDTR
jgi:zinc protease